MAPKPKPWERQPYETPKQYRAFATYLELGHERTLEKAGKILGNKASTLTIYSSRNHWVERVAQWENYEEQKRLKALEAERLKKYRQQIKGVEVAINKNLAYLKQDTIEETISPAAFTKNIIDLYKYQAELLGGFDKLNQTTPLAAVDSGLDVDRMTPEEKRDALQAIMREIQAELGGEQ